MTTNKYPVCYFAYFNEHYMRDVINLYLQLSWSILLMALFAFGNLFITNTLAQPSYPVIILDDAHNHLIPGADKSIIYTVNADKGLIIDATAYSFDKLKKFLNGNEPDKLFVVFEGGTFVARFTPGQRVIIDKHSLMPLLGNDTFRGFRNGDAPVIAIGTVRMEGKMPRMVQIWATTLHIEK